METIISLSEFIQLYEEHLTAIMFCFMGIVGGLFVIVNVAADLGFLLYRGCKKCAVALYRKAKK